MEQQTKKNYPKNARSTIKGDNKQPPVQAGQGRGQGVANDNDAMNGQARPGQGLFKIKRQSRWAAQSERVGMALSVQFRP